VIKNIFITLLLITLELGFKKTVAEVYWFISELIQRLLYQLKHISIGFDDWPKKSEVEKVVLIWKTKCSAKKVQKYRIADNVNKNSTWTLEELPKALNKINQSFLIIYTQRKTFTRWERFKKKANRFHINCLNWLFKKSFNHLRFITFLSQNKAVFVSNYNWWKRDLLLILSVKKKKWVGSGTNHRHWLQNATSTKEVRFCCVFSGI